MKTNLVAEHHRSETHRKATVVKTGVVGQPDTQADGEHTTRVQTLLNA